MSCRAGALNEADLTSGAGAAAVAAAASAAADAAAATAQGAYHTRRGA